MSTEYINGRVALVTGGGRGLGRAFAEALAGAGVAVAVTARTEDQLSDRLDVERVVTITEEQLGPVDILVNNAGIPGPSHPTWEDDPEEWQRTIEVNLVGPFLCAHAVLPGMITRRRGRIINISSAAGRRGGANLTAYRTSKAALSFWTNCLSKETAEYGISVFAYSPGVVRTAMFDYAAELPEVYKPVGDVFRAILAEDRLTPMEDVLRMFMFLASGRAEALSGRFVGASNDEAELLQRADEIQENDLYTLRLQT